MLLVGFAHTGGHIKIKFRYTLSTMLVILVCLNSGISQSSIVRDVLRFPQITVAAVKATGKQSGQVNLTAGGG